MALIKVIYVDGETIISGDNLNAIQDAIIALEQGGGGGGTTNYNELNNKPSIGGVTLSGNKSPGELGAIAAPTSPATGAFLVWNGSAWVAQTLSTWTGGSF